MIWGGRKYPAVTRGILVFLLASPGLVLPAEISTFKITNIESDLVLRYLFDEQAFYNSEGTKTQQDTRPTFQEEYRINTHSYVFHPNLLKMELGGSLLFDQSSVETLEAENSNNETLTGLNARLNFLEQKPYPVSLFYDRQNPSVSVGLGGRFLQENIKYGLDMALLQPVTPVQISVNAYRLDTFGEGFDQLTDEQREHGEIRFYYPYGKGDHAQLVYQVDDLDSRSGSPNQTIEPRTTSTSSANFDSRNLLGDHSQGQLTSNMAYNTQEEFPKREEFYFNPSLDWQHSASVSSFYRFNYTDSEEEDLDITLKRFSSGASYNGKRYNSSIRIEAEDNESTTLDYQSAGINYLLGHERKSSLGSLNLSYSGGYGYRDQVSTTDDALLDVLSEEHVLIGTAQVTLNREFIDTSTIEVWNTGRTQQYNQEGRDPGDPDYRVLVVGSQTQIQRLAVSNIADGQLVLVDYSYKTGGTFAYDQVNNNLNLSWGLSNFYEVYIRYRDSQQNLREGNPSIDLNSINSLTYGASIDRPMLSGIAVGGEAYVVDHEEDINPYTQISYNAYLELPLPRLTNLRLSARHLETDNENSEEDVDLTGYIFRLRSRPWLRTQLSIESSYETDIGGTLDRTLTIQRVQLNWAYRQLSLLADAHFSSEQQGDVDRERWAIKFILRRAF